MSETFLILPANEDKPWPTLSAIERLCTFAEMQLRDNYDWHGWEELQEAARVVRAVLVGKKGDVGV